MKIRKSAANAILALAITGWLCVGEPLTGYCQTPSANSYTPSSDLQGVAKLAKTPNIASDVVVNFSKGKITSLSADDIIYLTSQGVPQNIITAIQNNVSGQSAASNPSQPAPPSSPEPPALAPPSAGNSPSPEPPALSPPPAPQPALAPPAAPSGLQDNFYADGVLNTGFWQMESPLLASLGSMYGTRVLPALAFSPAGLQMSGTAVPGQFTGIQSTASFAAPFTFTASVKGLAQSGIPFDIYLVSPDLRQWVSIAGHLGGRGIGAVPRGPFGIRIPGGGNSPEYGVWINNSGTGLPISALGTKVFEFPVAGEPYTFQITAGADGMAAVSMLNASGAVLAGSTVPLGMGPFHVVLAARNGGAIANWQSVQMISTAAPQVAEQPPVVPATPTLDYFQSELTPYGNWVDVPGYGRCWKPAVEPWWRPYYDQGHWVYSDEGWFWQSEYAWGDIAFHYGRWVYAEMGDDPSWVWVPGYEYAPAWVFWRHAEADGYLGWAPLPPGAVFVGGFWEYNHARVAWDFDFRLGMGFFTFVAFDHFWEHDFRAFIVPRDRLDLIWRHSVIESHYRYEHGRFINEGLRRERMAELTHREVREERVHDLREREERRNAIARRDDRRDFREGDKRRADGPRGRDGGRRDDRHDDRGRAPERPGDKNPGAHPDSPNKLGQPGKPGAEPGKGGTSLPGAGKTSAPSKGGQSPAKGGSSSGSSKENPPK